MIHQNQQEYRQENAPINKQTSTAVGLSLIVAVISSVIIGAIFFAVLQTRLNATNRNLQSVQEQLQNQEIAIAKLNSLAPQEKLQVAVKEIDYSRFNFYIEEKNGLNSLMAKDVKTGATQVLTNLDGQFSFVGRYKSMVILTQKSDKCSDLSLKVWIYDLLNKQFQKKAGVTKNGSFSPDFRYYVYAVAPLEQEQSSWKLAGLDMENGVKVLDTLDKGLTLIKNIACLACLESLPQLHWASPSIVNYGVYEDLRVNCADKQNIGKTVENKLKETKTFDLGKLFN